MPSLRALPCTSHVLLWAQPTACPSGISNLPGGLRSDSQCINTADCLRGLHAPLFRSRLSHLCGSYFFSFHLCSSRPIERRRQWHPTPVLLPGKSHGRRSLVGCSHGVAKSRTRLSDFTFTFHCYALEKETATHSSVLAWRIPGTGEPGGLLSVGSHRVGHD